MLNHLGSYQQNLIALSTLYLFSYGLGVLITSSWFLQYLSVPLWLLVVGLALEFSQHPTITLWALCQEKENETVINNTDCPVFTWNDVVSFRCVSHSPFWLVVSLFSSVLLNIYCWCHLTFLNDLVFMAMWEKRQLIFSCRFVFPSAFLVTLFLLFSKSWVYCSLLSGNNEKIIVTRLYNSNICNIF